MHHYVEYNRAALKEMYRQVGGLELDKHGIAVRGLIVRHLVMPNDHAGTKAVLQWLADELGSDIGLSAEHARRRPPLARLPPRRPGQRRAGRRGRDRRPGHDPELSRRLTWREYREVVDFVETLPFENLFLQEDIAALDPSNDI